jgi:hypothetical protein
MYTALSFHLNAGLHTMRNRDLPAMSGALMVYVLCVSKATTAGMSSMSEVRWLRADEYSMNALNTGTGSIDSTLQHTAQHSMARHSSSGHSTGAFVVSALADT